MRQRGVRRRRVRGAVALLRLVTALAPAVAAGAQEGPLRAALAALDRPAPVASEALAAVTAEPGAPPDRASDALVPARSKAATIVLGAAFGAGLGAALGHDRRSRPRPTIEPMGWGDAAVLGAAGLVLARRGWPHQEPDSARDPRRDDCARVHDRINVVDRFWRRALAGPPARGADEVRAALRRRERLGHVSDLTLNASWAQPVAFLLAGGAPDAARDLFVYAEAGVVSLALTQIAKHAVHRTRPFARYCEPPDEAAARAGDARLSFFSGHAAVAFATSTAGWRLARMRGARHAGWLEGSGIALATTTGVLRVAADKHYFTDVLAGAAVGWGVGLLVTRLHRPASTSGAVPLPAADGATAARAAFASHAVYAWRLRGGARPGVEGLALRLGVVGGGPAVAFQWGF